MMYNYTKNNRRRRKPKKSLVSKVIRKIENRAERKFASILETTNTVTNAPSVPLAHLTGIAVGDTASTRDGNEIRVKSINLRYLVEANAAAVNSHVRVVLVRMKQTIADTAPDWNDIFEEDSVVSQKDHRLAQRFTILYDRTHSLSGSKGPTCFSYKWYKSCDLKVKFNDGTSSDYEAGQIFLFACGSEATNQPAMIFTTRMSYVDL